MNENHYIITIFEENGVMHFHSSPDWGDYRKQKGLDPGVAVDCDIKDMERWERGQRGPELYARTQKELRDILDKHRNKVS